MKAKIGEDIVDVWQISRDEPEEDWVIKLFENKNLRWYKDFNALQYTPGITIFGAYGGGQMTIGKCGDWLVYMHGGYKMIPSKRFNKDYTVLD